MPARPTSPPPDGVLLRSARSDDDADLIRLAALDGTRPLSGPALVAEERGVIVAALSLSTGRAVADPFVRSLHLVELLRQHAARRQTSAAAPPLRRLLRLAFRAGRPLIGARRSS